MKANAPIVGLVFLIFFVISLLTNILGPLIPDIKQSFGLSDSLVANLPLAFFGAYVASVLFSYYKASSNVVRQRAKMIFFGVTLAFLPTLMVFLFVHFVKLNFPINLTIYFILSFPASMAYAIIRLNLFDADTIIRRTVCYAVVTAIIIGAYVLVSISFNVLLGKYEIAQSKVFPIVFTLVIILIFNPLRNRIQSLVDRLFFRKEYDYGEIVDKISGAMTSMLEMPLILKRLVQTFMEDMFINTSSVMLLAPAVTEFQVFLAEGEQKQTVEKVALKQDNPLMEIRIDNPARNRVLFPAVAQEQCSADDSP